MTCRLPQTPRTPTTAAAHYFDDMFTVKGRPKKPVHFRRSSTTRSIGYRSDIASTNDEDEEFGEPINRTSSIGYLNQDELQKKADMDRHVASYVNDQLERMKSGESGDVDGGEFEASLDGTLDQTRPNEKHNGDMSYFDKDPAERR